MRMFLPLALAGAALLSACSDPPAYLIQPADPRLAVRAPRYTNVVAGVKHYDVVDPKDWRELNRAVTPKPGQGGMEGMDHSKMPGMNGKAGQGGMESMPGMNMPGMGGKRDTGGR
jgi:hypothetical protein